MSKRGGDDGVPWSSLATGRVRVVPSMETLAPLAFYGSESVADGKTDHRVARTA